MDPRSDEGVFLEYSMMRSINFIVDDIQCEFVNHEEDNYVIPKQHISPNVSDKNSNIMLLAKDANT